MSNVIAIDDVASLEAEVDRIVSLPYRRELVPNEDGTWFARIVELPGCMTEGDTQSEALVNLDDAMRSWVAVQLEDGDPIPPPSAAVKYSGKFMVRVAPTLHRDVAERAERESVSLNSFVMNALARSVGRMDVVVTDASGKRYVAELKSGRSPQSATDLAEQIASDGVTGTILGRPLPTNQ